MLETESLQEDNLYPLTLSNLGLLYHTTGRYSMAEDFTIRALDLRKAKQKIMQVATGLRLITWRCFIKTWVNMMKLKS
jgi:hypothetical protein